MNRRRFADHFALGCGVVTLLSITGCAGTLAMAAMVTGAAVLIWSLVWPN
jgi:hypothetical protein